MHEKNGLAERGWKTIVNIKNLMLIDIGLPNGFWAEVIETTNYFWNRLLVKSKNHREVIPKEA